MAGERCTNCHVERPSSQLKTETYEWAPGHFAKGTFCPYHLEEYVPAREAYGQ